MADEAAQNGTTTPKAPVEKQEEQFEVVFKNGALKNLKELATLFGVPETELSKIVSKSTRLLTIVKNAKKVSFEDESGNRYYVDVRAL